MLIFAAPAGAHIASPRDGNDTRGLFDIRRAYFTHRDGSVRVSVRTADGWNPSVLGQDVPNNGFDDNAFEFQFDSRGNGYSDYVVVVDWQDDQLEAELLRFVPFGERTTDTESIGFVGVQKEGRVLRIKVPRYRLHPRDSYIGWVADSFFRASEACDGADWCKDHVPDRGLFVHRLR